MLEFELDIKNVLQKWSIIANFKKCYYFDDILKFEDFDVVNILIDKKLYENVLVYKISYKTLISAKPLCRTRYLILFGAEKYDFIYNRIIYLIGVTCGITCVISQNYAKIKVDSYDSLPLKKCWHFIML